MNSVAAFSQSSPVACVCVLRPWNDPAASPSVGTAAPQKGRKAAEGVEMHTESPGPQAPPYHAARLTPGSPELSGTALRSLTRCTCFRVWSPEVGKKNKTKIKQTKGFVLGMCSVPAE